MKKIILCALCAAMMLTAASCGGKSTDSNSQNPSIGDIPTAEADKGKTDSENTGDEPVAQSDSNSGTSDSDSKSDKTDNKSSQTGGSDKADTSDRTPTTDRAEIQNNIRDAKELIDEGLIDDAKAIIRVLRSRELTKDEEKQVDELEAKMLKVSD